MLEYADGTDQEHRVVKSVSDVRCKLRCNCLCNHGCVPVPQTRLEKQTDMIILKCKYREESR